MSFYIFRITVKEVEIVGEEETIAGFVYAEPPDHLETPPVREDTTIAEICPDYKWGRCPNYEECDFRHPRDAGTG